MHETIHSLQPLCYHPNFYCTYMSHDLGAVTIFRFLEVGLKVRIRVRLGSGLGLRLGLC